MFTQNRIPATLLHSVVGRPRWLNRASTCPICKRDVTDTSAPVADSPARAERPRARNFLSNLVQRAGRAGRVGH